MKKIAILLFTLTNLIAITSLSAGTCAIKCTADADCKSAACSTGKCGSDGFCEVNYSKAKHHTKKAKSCGCHKDHHS